MDASAASYRITIRYHDRVPQYETFELSAGDLREAVERTLERFPEHTVSTADLVEIRQANPADGG